MFCKTLMSNQGKDGRFLCGERENCLRKEQEQEMAKPLKYQEGPSQSSCCRSCCSAQSQSKSDEVEDQGKSFSADNYKSAMTYLEDAKNYMALFGDGLKTLVGVKLITKTPVFEVFEAWLHQLNNSLLLNGQRLRQQLNKLLQVFKESYLIKTVIR
ncbi:hypothetical protein VP01_3940g1 [Puccinia sorghi]|uniref:Uncharacterized protein n=1 Tax=Puccinia sorghi TaxID=27349 RepID=A0A0L6UUE0_9BASI|nr:hypothetical protein VP01_3940g1 [Puccinia sorghi]